MKMNLLYASALAIPFALFTAGNANAQAADTTQDSAVTTENVGDQALANATTEKAATESNATSVSATQATTNAPLVVSNDPTSPNSDPDADARVAAGIAATENSAATTQDNSTEATDTTGNYTEGRAYWIANPDYTIWDTPYSASSNKVADGIYYTHTAFKGLGQATNAAGNVYENITNNDNVTGWIYLPALTTVDPAAPAEETPAEPAAPAEQKGFFDKVKDTADKVNAFNTSVTDAVSSTQKLVQTPLDVATNAITHPINKINEIKDALGKIPNPVKDAVDAAKNVGSKLTSGLSGIKDAVSGVTGFVKQIAGLFTPGS
ncbi:hypothetical protein [Companilactobacillus mishanensis]|uniref:hypothetical protein n=1 Tax=Companilactobacillus mishanensis TaxID=2486008 RepID=UPI001296F781|nr:hypothetical protein [Companilactobacillus mishanensis]MQS88610.1 hypothetical protein [Companilactobacillus mishanensis]